MIFWATGILYTEADPSTLFVFMASRYMDDYHANTTMKGQYSGRYSRMNTIHSFVRLR